jgi:organic radical activating enzyme
VNNILIILNFGKKLMLDVVEIFGPTIQGEGKYIGNPSVFIRFGGCNMTCSGFGVEYETPSGIKKLSCDSFHASDNLFKDQWTKYKTSQDLINVVDKILPSYKINIVLTGGEPLLYWNNNEFQKFMKFYIDNGYHITIETNGSLDILLKEQWQKKILFSISVKLSNSGEKITKRLNINTLNNIINFVDDVYLKFVVDNKFLSKVQEEIDSILLYIPDVEVYLMPLGDTSDILDNNCLDVIEMAIKNGFKYSDRLHIRVWNNKRGV